ncbi:MAG TPA: hypothetical protein VFR18_07650 [Terriglobia bacterium]|nr:hypothetical protein [Terriglobia bacterium]
MKYLTILILLIAFSALSACAEEQMAQKAAVDLQSAADVKSAAASQTAAAKAATTGQTPASAKAAKTPAATPGGASAKDAVPPVPGPAKAPVAPAAGAAKVPPAPARGEAKTPVPGKPDPKAAAPAKSVKVDDPPPALSVPPGFEYTPGGRRDPFINPVSKPVVGSTVEEIVPVIRPDGLPGVLVSEVRLSGIIHSSDQTMNKAMLVVGRNTYFAKKGDSLFDGVIKEIRSNEVVFGMVSATTRKPVNRDTVVRTGASSGTSAGEKK